MSGIDISISLFQLLNVPSVTGLLGGGRVYRFNRPINSRERDVVISIPEYSAGQFNTGQIDVNIHVPNLELHADQTTPDLASMKLITDAILPLIGSQAGYDLTELIPGIPVRDDDGQWYCNIRLQFSQIDPSLSVEVDMVEIVGVADGFGGMITFMVVVWSGLAAQTNIADGSQLSSMGAKYDLNLKCDWIVPFLPDFAPQKDMHVVTDEGEYIINGIKPENGFWRLSTYRKDAPYV